MNIKLDGHSEKYICEMIRKGRFYCSSSVFANKAIVSFCKQKGSVDSSKLINARNSALDEF